ncbi:MAG: hypothetical protein ABI197_07435 [Granulicella sp.]
MDFLGHPVGFILFIHDAGEAKQLEKLSADANTSPTSATEIRRGRDHKRGVRGTSSETFAGCKVVLSPLNVLLVGSVTAEHGLLCAKLTVYAQFTFIAQFTFMMILHSLQ